MQNSRHKSQGEQLLTTEKSLEAYDIVDCSKLFYVDRKGRDFWKITIASLV